VTLELNEALRRLPKVELHCHLEGCLRPTTAADLAIANDVPLPLAPGAPVTDLYRYGSLDEFLAVFWLVQSLLCQRGDWERLAYEAVLDGAASGRVYAEVFVTPARHLAAGQPLRDILAGVDTGLAAGEAETGSRTRVILDMDRAFGPAAGRQLVDELVELRRDGYAPASRVIGVGMDSTEIGVDPKSFAPAYAVARSAGLRLTGHQGEDTPPAAIADVLDVLGAERIDHGLSVTAAPDLVARMAGEQIPLTVCPTSNVVIANRVASLADHPFTAMRDAGLLVTINTDDPALTDLSLAGEYADCAQAWGWSFHTAVDVALAGVEAAWLDPDDKRALAQRLRGEADALAAQLASPL
jgi:adenosine deaminase